jgi:hypothetical protein
MSHSSFSPSRLSYKALASVWVFPDWLEYKTSDFIYFLLLIGFWDTLTPPERPGRISRLNHRTATSMPWIRMNEKAINEQWHEVSGAYRTGPAFFGSAHTICMGPF